MANFTKLITIPWIALKDLYHS
jgi:hypothetical protein